MPTTITRHAYEICNYLQQKDQKWPYPSLGEWHNIIEKRECEADKRAIKFVECPLLAYQIHKNYGKFDETTPVGCEEYFSEIGYQDGGYCTFQKMAQLNVEQLVSEGHLKVMPHKYDKKIKPQNLISLTPPITLYNIQYVDEIGFNATQIRSKL